VRGRQGGAQTTAGEGTEEAGFCVRREVDRLPGVFFTPPPVVGGSSAGLPLSPPLAVEDIDPPGRGRLPLPPPPREAPAGRVAPLTAALTTSAASPLTPAPVPAPASVPGPVSSPTDGALVPPIFLGRPVPLLERVMTLFLPMVFVAAEGGRYRLFTSLV
jgi:hypothetical protein